jgi:LytS/YehU family sensor histidine kinase
LNPHFLFNALNSIQALITESPSRAEFAVEKLAGLLRHSLRQDSDCETSLAEELDVIGEYLAIEKIRFEEKSEVRTDVEPKAENCLVPMFLFHPLVENAIKHGMQTSDVPLKVRIRAALTGDLLSLEIANSGAWRNHDPGRAGEQGLGIGLRLVRERLEQAYPGRHRFERSCEGGWVIQRIELQTAGRAHAAARIAG